jgi:hypothetical protein
MAVLTDSTLANEAEVGATSKALRVTPYLNNLSQPVVKSAYNFTTSPGGIVLAGLSDGNATANRVGRFGSEATADVIPLMWEEFEGGTINGQRWAAANTTFAAAQTAQGYSLNPTGLFTAAAVAVLLSVKRYTRFARAPLLYRTRSKVSNFQNSQNDFGLADTVSGITQIANGAYFQMTTAGRMQAVLTTNSSDVTVPINFGTHVFDPDIAYVWDIIVDDDSVSFFIQETREGKLVGRAELNLSPKAQRMFSSTHLSAFYRGFNFTGLVPPRPLFHVISYCFLGIVDTALPKTWEEILAFNTQGSIISPTAFTQTAAYANSAEPGSATLSNTTATYANTVLGGKFQFAAVAGAATDYIVFGFSVPAPYSLVVKSIQITTWSVGAASSASVPTNLSWGCHVNAPAVTLASNSIRRFIGDQVIGVSTPIGGMASPTIRKKFAVPLVTHSGRFFDIVLRMPTGAATASQVIAGAVDIDGYFE